MRRVAKREKTEKETMKLVHYGEIRLLKNTDEATTITITARVPFQTLTT